MNKDLQIDLRYIINHIRMFGCVYIYILHTFVQYIYIYIYMICTVHNIHIVEIKLDTSIIT